MRAAKRGALLCAIFGSHLLLFRLIDVGGNPRRAHRSEEDFVTITLVDFSKPDDTQPSTLPSPGRSIPTHEPSTRSRVEPDNSITPPPEAEATDSRVDWHAEASRVAGDAARRMDEEKKLRSFDEHPAGMGPLPPKSSGQKVGDSLHLEGGVIIDWVSSGCYYSNQDVHIAAFGPALRLQLPTCGAGGGGRGGGEKALPTIEEWKKERDNR
jgi:hypothetical protein